MRQDIRVHAYPLQLLGSRSQADLLLTASYTAGILAYSPLHREQATGSETFALFQRQVCVQEEGKYFNNYHNVGI